MVWTTLNRRVFLGDDDFVARMQALGRDGPPDRSVPQAQQRPPAPPPEAFAQTYATRDAAIAEAFGVHFTTVGRIVRAARRNA